MQIYTLNLEGVYTPGIYII